MAYLDLFLRKGPLNFSGSNFANFFQGGEGGPQARPLDPLLMNTHKCIVEY